MHDDILFNFKVDKPSLSLIVKAVDDFVQRWPGGDPEEQENAKSIQTELHKAFLEIRFLEGVN